MPNNHDAILLETVKTHRARLLAAFIYGELSERRVANDNVRRLLGSIIVAAVACAGCLGFSIVSSLLASQAKAAAAQAAGSASPQPPYASDSFSRSVASGWGRGELGGAWTTIGEAGDLSVSNGLGRLQLPSGGGERGAYLASDLRDGTDTTVVVQPAIRASRGGLNIVLLGRRINDDTDFRVVVSTGAQGNLVIALNRLQNGRSTPLSDTVAMLGAPQPGDPIHVRLQTYGENPTTLKAKAWTGNGSEPTNWTVQATDETTSMQRPGAVGVAASWTGEGAPLTVGVQDFVSRPFSG